MPSHRPTTPARPPDLAEQVEAWVSWTFSFPCQRCNCEGRLYRVGARELCAICCAAVLLEQF